MATTEIFVVLIGVVAIAALIIPLLLDDDPTAYIENGLCTIFVGGGNTTCGSVLGNVTFVGDLPISITANNQADQITWSFGSIPFFDEDWQNRKLITINSTEVNSDLTSFPFLINFTDNDLRDFARVNGDDILFTHSDGVTQLSHEMTRYDSSNGYLTAWVKVNVTSESDQTIFMYYNNPASPNQENVEDVWTGQDYWGVFHINDNSTSQTFSSARYSGDSIIHDAVRGTSSLNGTIDNIEGELIVNSSSTTDFGSWDTGVGVTDFVIFGDYTTSFWARFVGGSPEGTQGSFWSMGLGQADHWFIIQKSQDFLGLWDGGFRPSAISRVGLDGWHYITQRGFEANETTTFRLDDGVQGGNSNIDWKIDGELGCFGGGSSPNPECRNGLAFGVFDEVRWTKGIISNDWIDYEYCNQFTNSFINGTGTTCPAWYIGLAEGQSQNDHISLGNATIANVFKNETGGIPSIISFRGLSEGAGINITERINTILIESDLAQSLCQIDVFLGFLLQGTFDCEVEGDNVSFVGLDGIAITNTSSVVFSLDAKADKLQDVNYTTINLNVPFFDEDWESRKQITINSTEVNTDLTGFPFLVNFTDTELRDFAQADGDDILFTDSDGQTQIPHELTRYDSSNGYITAWVKVDVTSASDKKIFMYYNNPTVSATENPENVWTGKDYWAVMHVNDNSTSIAENSARYSGDSQFHDAVRATSSVNGTIDNIEGEFIVNASRTFKFGSWDFGDEADFTATDDYTLTFWAKFPLSEGSALQNNMGNAGNVQSYLMMSVFFTTEPLAIHDGSTVRRSTLDTAFLEDGWHYITSRVDFQDDTIFRVNDGSDPNPALDGNHTISGTPFDRITAGIGCFGGAGLGIPQCRSGGNAWGDFDEFRLSNDVSSDDWLDFEYCNQYPSSFINGSETTCPAWHIGTAENQEDDIPNENEILIYNATTSQFENLPLSVVSGLINVNFNAEEASVDDTSGVDCVNDITVDYLDATDPNEYRRQVVEFCPDSDSDDNLTWLYSVPNDYLDEDFNFRLFWSDEFVEPPNSYTQNTKECDDHPDENCDEGDAESGDSEEHLTSGRTFAGSTDLELHDSAAEPYSSFVAMQFENVPIPQGETITSAKIQFHVDEVGDNSALTVRFFGEDIDNSPPLSPFPDICGEVCFDSDISDRTETTAFVDWAIPSWVSVSDEGAAQLSADLSPIIQEIVDRGGWVAGNDLTIMIKEWPVDDGGQRTAESAEGEPSNSPEITITWGTPTPEVAPVCFEFSLNAIADTEIVDGNFIARDTQCVTRTTKDLLSITNFTVTEMDHQFAPEDTVYLRIHRPNNFVPSDFEADVFVFGGKLQWLN